ncbi:phosphotriesterase [Microbacterium pseudoresistens]|uniref:Phosphotriesterase-related protein n=1 Tax=Microbacterium pseudoresistens TaxID=640634 RepID=A0A7Y9EU34_9MICO|nr:phosphotriesterase [Microbacterium pseudoresistens]NYD53943.1 phosphotriesterase-related protein [Microbacterium pseudoresistens]
MGIVNTVLGAVPAEALGVTAMHEHISFGQPGWELNSRSWRPAHEVIALAEQMIGDFHGLGGRTYVELTGIGFGRDISRFRVIAKSTGVNFVACTGFWTGQGVRPFFRDKPVEYLADLFIKEITEGIDGTDAKAGIIKVGVQPYGLTELDERIYRAAGRAAAATGVPVVTHLAVDADRQLDLLESEGLAPERVILGHIDVSYDLDRARDIRVVTRGAYVGIDLIGYDSEKADAEHPAPAWARPRRGRLLQLVDLIQEGWADRLIISADANCAPLGWVSLPHSVAELLDSFVPEVRGEGIDEDLITQMLVRNPAALLTMTGS